MDGTAGASIFNRRAVPASVSSSSSTCWIRAAPARVFMDPASHDGRSEPARKVEVRSVDIAFLDGDRTLAVHDDAACERLACNGRAQEAEHVSSGRSPAGAADRHAPRRFRFERMRQLPRQLTPHFRPKSSGTIRLMPVCPSWPCRILSSTWATRRCCPGRLSFKRPLQRPRLAAGAGVCPDRGHR